jgi:hypothetical protein
MCRKAFRNEGLFYYKTNENIKNRHLISINNNDHLLLLLLFYNKNRRLSLTSLNLFKKQCMIKPFCNKQGLCI